jgi:H+-translocating NAD(P) transhydrogenase subunit alpha
VVTENLVTILAPDNLPATMPIGASAFYARNLSALLLQLVRDGALNLDPADEIAGPVTITHGGEIRSDAVRKLLQPAEAKA